MKRLGNLQRRLRRTTDLRFRARLHLIVLVKAGKVQTRQQAADTSPFIATRSDAG